MSRSVKKAIVKDKGHRKACYWKIVRRAEGSTLRDYLTQNRYLADHHFIGTSYFEERVEEYMDLRMSYEEAYDYTWENDEADSDGDFNMVSTLQLEWWEEPEFKSPKVLVNDYDYCDYINDYENILGGGPTDINVIHNRRK